MKSEYDEGGEQFFYFIIPFCGFFLLLVTCCVWPSEEEEEKEKNVPNSIETLRVIRYGDSYQLVQVEKPKRTRREALLTKIGLVLIWIVLIIVVYCLLSNKTEYEEYDPFAVLGVAPEASVSEIKRVYHELSKTHHPDRGGDPEKFKEIAKAYKTLTNEEAKENWRKYGNPDGPRELRLGFAIPKWFLDRQNSMFVLLMYTSIFVLPIVVICLSK